MQTNEKGAAPVTLQALFAQVKKQAKKMQSLQGDDVTCWSYCDTTREKHGDYLEIGRLYFSPLRIEIFDKNKKYSEVHKIMQKDFNKLSKQDSVIVSGTGQTAAITLMK